MQLVRLYATAVDQLCPARRCKPLAPPENKAIVALAATGEKVKPKNGNQSKAAVGFVCEHPFQSTMRLDGSGLSKALCFACGSVALKAIGVTQSAAARALTVQLHSIEERNNLDLSSRT